MIEIFNVLGSRHEPAFAERLHRLDHRGALDIVTIPVAELARRRLLITSRAGEQLAIALPRSQKLFDGAVLLVDDVRAIVVQAAAERWLRLEPASIADAVELGYHAGNLHWRVRFDGDALLVALEGRPEDYTARLAELIASHRVTVRILEGAAVSGPVDQGGGTHSHAHDHHHHHHDHGARP
jgi:urease accessory protein